MFSEVFEQVGKKLTQKAISKAVPCVGAAIGGVIDTVQMVQITQYAEVFCYKRFLLEKEARICTLTGMKPPVVDVSVIDDDCIS